MRHNITSARGRAALAAIALAVVLLAGCRGTCTVPRIDPTGESLFAGTTTIDPQLGQLPTPQPAFVAPPVPPPCNQPGGGCHKKHINLHTDKLCAGIQRELTCVGDEGQLIVTPATVVAPVGSEVVVLAGLCGPERTFVARQPIEFVMSQESVGNFVAVGEDGECAVTRLYRSQPKKADSGYVVAVSSAKDQIVTRGTPQPTDDVRLGRGQTWLSVTSPSEGTSYITVLAPKAKNWDQRRQTATIHWVDAQYALPGPAIVPAGRKHRLTTTVRRAGGTVPAVDSKVRYEVTSGEPALFANNQSVIEVPVDAQGNASVDIQQANVNAGTTTVSIQIVRPGYAGAAPLVIGQGITSITWSAPGLAVAIRGNENIPIGTESTLQIDVTNSGDIPTREIVIRDRMPPGLQFAGSNPPPRIDGNVNEWAFDEIGPKQTRSIVVKVQAVRGGNFHYQVEASSQDGVRSAADFPGRVAQQALTMTLSGPPNAAVGEPVTFRVEVNNAGDQILSNVRLIARFDRGLEHQKGYQSPLAYAVTATGGREGELQPRQKVEYGITLIPRQPGELCLNMEASADGAELVAQKVCINAGVREAPGLSVTKTGPGQVSVGSEAEYILQVTNTGNVPLTNVKISDQYSTSMSPNKANPGYEFERDTIFWTIPELQPNVVVTRKVHCVAMKPDANAVNRVTVTTKEGVTGEDAITTRIVATAMRLPLDDARGGAAKETEPGNTDDGGELKLSVRAAPESVKIGEVQTFFFSLTNARNVSDRQVRLQITLPEGMTFVRLSGRVTGMPTVPDPRTIDVTPIAEMRPNETIEGLKLEVRAVAAGKQKLEAKVISQRDPKGAAIEQPTTVFP
jgi:uncharacterized repeat protein (TIGR01451 family)